MHFSRNLSISVCAALKRSPVVFVNGPRQAGKSTLVQSLISKDYPAEYVTLDHATQIAAAVSSPETFLAVRKGPLIIDEVQMVPEIFRTLKQVVDDGRTHNPENNMGRFLLTGSANIMALPQLADALVGRMRIKTLYPFSSSEVLDGKGDFLNQLFAKEFRLSSQQVLLHEVVARATFPEISGKSSQDIAEWCEGYITTLLQRDVRQFSEIEKLAMLPKLLRIMAARAASLINDADIARDAGLNPVTGKAYRQILHAVFLCNDVPPWYRNIGKRLVKSPKGFLVDTLLLSHLLGMKLSEMEYVRPELFGHAVENFVAMELRKLLSFSNIQAQLFHFRTSDNKEVDFVLERADGTLAGIEVKTSDQVDGAAFKGLRLLQESSGADFICGIVLYQGKQIVPFGEKLFAVPFSALWA